MVDTVGRQPRIDHGRFGSDGRRRQQPALRLVKVHRNGQEWYERGQKPNTSDEAVNDSLRHPASVTQRIFNVDVPVDTPTQFSLLYVTFT